MAVRCSFAEVEDVDDERCPVVPRNSTASKPPNALHDAPNIASPATLDDRTNTDRSEVPSSLPVMATPDDVTDTCLFRLLDDLPVMNPPRYVDHF
jgi:hypothetical protein